MVKSTSRHLFYYRELRHWRCSQFGFLRPAVRHTSFNNIPNNNERKPRAQNGQFAL